MELLALTLMPSLAVVVVGYLLVARAHPPQADPPQADPRGWLDEVARRRVLVHTRDGQTIDGQLIRVDVDGVVLGPAALADGELDLDGEVFVPRDRVAWVQRPNADEPGSGPP